jgi:hypothetical protein
MQADLILTVCKHSYGQFSDYILTVQCFYRLVWGDREWQRYMWGVDSQQQVRVDPEAE